jgi:hypothetical protein
MQRRADPLRRIADSMNLPTLQEIAGQPGVNAAYRVTIEHAEFSRPQQTATLIISHAGAELTSLYNRPPDRPTITYTLPKSDRAALESGLKRIGFDRMDDQPGVEAAFGAEIWLFERAVGSLYRDVVLLPDQAEDDHAELVVLLRKVMGRGLLPLTSG